MKFAVVVAVETVAAVVATSGLDASSQRVVLYTAAAAGVLWAWVHVVKPALRWARSIFKSAEAFEELPEWMAIMESEQAKLMAAVTRVENHQRAFNRDMGITARAEGARPVLDAEQAYDVDIEDGQRLSGPP